MIEDSKSLHGTFINNIKLERPRRLCHGDAVRFGDQIARLDGECFQNTLLLVLYLSLSSSLAFGLFLSDSYLNP